jgi:hypothetical protein
MMYINAVGMANGAPPNPFQPPPGFGANAGGWNGAGEAEQGAGGEGAGSDAVAEVESAKDKRVRRDANRKAIEQIRFVQSHAHGLLMSKLVFQQKVAALLPDSVSSSYSSSYSYSGPSSSHAAAADVEWVTAPALGALQVFVEHELLLLLERALLVARSPDCTIATSTHSHVLTGADVSMAIQMLQEEESGGAFKTYAQSKTTKVPCEQEEGAAPWHCCAVVATGKDTGAGAGAADTAAGDAAAADDDVTTGCEHEEQPRKQASEGTQHTMQTKVSQKRARREITIIFNGLSGDQVRLVVDLSLTNTIGQLKQLYEADQGIPADSLMLMHLDRSPRCGGGGVGSGSSGGSSTGEDSMEAAMDIGSSLFDESEDELGGLADTLSLESAGLHDGSMIGVMPLDWCIEVLPEGGQPMETARPPSPLQAPQHAPVGRGGAGGNRRKGKGDASKTGGGAGGSGSGKATGDGSSASLSTLITSTDAVLPAVEAALAGARIRLSKIHELEKAAKTHVGMQLTKRERELGLKYDFENQGSVYGFGIPTAPTAAAVAAPVWLPPGSIVSGLGLGLPTTIHGAGAGTKQRAKSKSPTKSPAKSPAKCKSPPKSKSKSKTKSRTPKGKGKEGGQQGAEETRRKMEFEAMAGSMERGTTKAAVEDGKQKGADTPGATNESAAYSLHINAPKDANAHVSREAAAVRVVERLSGTPTTKRCIDPAIFEIMLRETATLTAGLHCYWSPEAVVAAQCLAEARLKKLIRRAICTAEHRYPGIVAEQSMRRDLPPMSPRVEGCVYGSDLEEVVSAALGADMASYGGNYGLPLPLPADLGWRGPRRPVGPGVGAGAGHGEMDRDRMSPVSDDTPIVDSDDEVPRYPRRNRAPRAPGGA